MNKQGIIKSVSTLFPIRWHSATSFGVHPVKFASRNELFNRVNQVLISIIMASFCGINRINKISSFTGDGLTSITPDADSTVKSVCDNQKGAAKGFNTTKVEYLCEKSSVSVYQYACYISN